MRLTTQQKKMNRIKKLVFRKNVAYSLNWLMSMVVLYYVVHLAVKVGIYEVFDFSRVTLVVVWSKLITMAISHTADKAFWRVLAEDCAKYPFETTWIF